METCDREQLYKQVWDEPLTKVAAKYGVSDVMVAKICRKLSIPILGRGYWAQKAAGQKLSVKPLPKLKEAPVIQRPKVSDSSSPRPEPDDPLYIRICEMESRSVTVESVGARHQSVIATQKRLTSGSQDRDGLLVPRSNSDTCLDLRVSRGVLDRALDLVNALIVSLEAEGFKVSMGHGLHGTSGLIFGHEIKFGIVELLEVTRTREEGDSYWKRKVRDHRPTGRLELRIDDFAYGPRLRDRSRVKLEERLPECVAALMRQGRKKVLAAEEHRIREADQLERQREIAKLSEEIRKEEARIKELEAGVTGWSQARQIREFANALEAVWTGRDDTVVKGQNG